MKDLIELLWKNCFFNEVCRKIILGELSGIVNQTLRERIDKSIVGKLIIAKVNFGLGNPIKKYLINKANLIPSFSIIMI